MIQAKETGNSRLHDINQETYMGTIPILAKERLYSFRDVGLSAAGFGIASWCYVQGAFLAAHVRFPISLMLCVVPVMLISLFVMLLVIIPARFGVDLWMYQRAVFGHRFAFILCITALLITWGWYAINCGVFAGSIVKLGQFAGADLGWGTRLFSACCAVLGLLLAIKGPYQVKRATYVMVPALIVVGIILLIEVLAQTDLGELSSFQPIYKDQYPTAQIAFLCTAEAMVAFVFGWYPALGGLSRLAKTERGSYWGHVLGYGFAMCVFTMIGCVCSTLISGRFGYFTSNPADWLAALSGPVWAVIAILTIVVANITTQMTGVYCLSMAVKVFRPAWPDRRIAIGMTLFCILLILWDGVWTYYDLFLAIVSLSASPACGIIFADFFLVRRDKFNLKACFLRDGHREYCYTHGFNGAALLSFLAGVCLYLLIYNPLQGTVNNLFLMHLTPTAASSAFAGLFYALLCRIPGVNRYCVPEKRGTLER